MFRAVFRHWAVSAAGASCLQGRFAPLLVMESGLPDGACMLWISIPQGEYAFALHGLTGTPKVPGGTRPLRTGNLAAKPVIFPRDAVERGNLHPSLIH